MPISFGFGRKTASQDTTRNAQTTTATDSTQNQSGLQSTRSAGSSSTSQTGASSGASSTAGSTTQEQLQQQQTQQQQTTTAFRDPVLNTLEGRVMDLLQSIGGGSSAMSARNAALGGAANFDPESFVAGIMDNATRRSESQREQQINVAQNAIGGTVNSNSAAALLASRINDDANANLAGIQSSAVAQAMQILNQNAATASGAVQSDAGLVGTLLDSLKGGVTTGTVSGTATTAGTTRGSQQQQTQTQEQNVQQQNQQRSEIQDVLSQLVTMLKGTENARTSETSNTRNRQTGFGITGSF